MFKSLPKFGKRIGRTVLGTLLCLAVLATFLSAPSLAADKDKDTAVAKKVDTPPQVTRGSATHILDDSSTLIFTVQSKDSEKNLRVFVYYGEEDGGDEPDKWSMKTGPVRPDKFKKKNEYSVDLKDLKPNTNYFYSIQAEDGGGITWSGQGAFVTAESGLPIHKVLLILLGVAAAFAVPFWLGDQIAKRVRMPDYGWRIGVILCSITLAIIVIKFGTVSLGIDLSGGTTMVYEIDNTVVKDDKGDDELGKDKMMEKLINAITMRVNPGGTREVSIVQYGMDQIQIIIPKASEEKVKRIKKNISETGTLEFRILANRRNPKHQDLIARAEMSPERNRILNENKKPLAWWVPISENREDDFRLNKTIATRASSVGGIEMLEVLVISDNFNVKGDYLRRCSADNDEYGRPCVRFNFNSSGARRFGALTGNNLPEKGAQEVFYHLGIILNGYLYSAPTINSRITNSGIITGSFTREETQDLVNVLNAGSLPATLSKFPISELSVGPTLGDDMVRKGKIAITTSVIIVLIFMAIYYGFAGLVACGALLMNMLLLFGIMIAIHADFTLPGIAGLVLTVGMAVDANVLIFERIREELDRGSALRMAIRNGFAKATTTIVDANVTTLITAIVLFVVGTQQIKGFAVTLFLGVTLSMFTAIFCARVVFDITERRRIITKLSMRRILGKTNFNFIGIQRIGILFSLILICAGIFAVYERGEDVLDIDFTGGESVTLRFKEKQELEDVRKKLIPIFPYLTINKQWEKGKEVGVQYVITTPFAEDADDLKNEDRSAIQLVEDKIYGVYGQELETNALEDYVIVPLNAEGQPAVEPSATSSTGSTSLADEDTKLTDQEPADTPTATEEAPLEQPKAEEAQPVEALTPAPIVYQFANGSEVKLVLNKPLDHDTMKEMIGEILTKAEIPTTTSELFNDKYRLGDTDGYEIWKLRIALSEADTKSKVILPLREKLSDLPFFPSSSSIGSRIAGDYQKSGILAIVASLICIVAYIWIRFQRVIFGLAAVVALVHDVLITLGAIALSAYVASALGFLMIEDFKISLSVLAAFLTIIGYSLNDTIVVFDRIREVRGKSPNLNGEMVNKSLNQTLSRTLLTSFTTFVVVLVLYIGGGSGIHAFSFTLLVGVLVGTYSSMFIASPVLLWMSPSETPKK